MRVRSALIFGALGVLIALILTGYHVYQANGSLFGESPAKSVSLKDSDLPPGMTRCTSAGWPQGKGAIPDGATDVWTVVYADACNVPPSRRYASTWVLEFKSETAAVVAYQAFTGSLDCTIAHGCVDWGLGQNSKLNCGTDSCLGTWQRNAFMFTFESIMGIDEAKKAVLNMDARAHQIPALVTTVKTAGGTGAPTA